MMTLSIEKKWDYIHYILFNANNVKCLLEIFPFKNKYFNCIA